MVVHRLVNICTALAICSVPFAMGNPLTEQYDLSLKTGAHIGGIVKPAKNEDESAERFTFGGAPIAVVFNKDYSESMSILFEAGIIADIAAKQVTKQGFYAGIGYHFLGGARRIVRASEFATITRSDSYNVSLLFMGGMQHFSASERDNTDRHVTGAIFETVTGLQYRQDLGDSNSVGIEFLQILLTLPASVERLETTGSSLLFFWRTFI